MGNLPQCACTNEHVEDVIDQLGPLPAGIIRLDKRRIKEAIELVTRSYSGTRDTDPEWSSDWVVGPHLRERYNDKRRTVIMQWIHGLTLGFAMRDSAVILAATRPDGTLAGICVAYSYVNGRKPPGEVELKMRRMFHMRRLGAPPYAKKPLAETIGKGIEKRYDSLQKESRWIHRKHAPADHWHVALMATDKDAQGKGYCAKLMRMVSSLADAQNALCFLATSGQRNVGIFERFGYEIDGKYTLSCAQDPDGAQPYDEFYAMVRPAKGAWTSSLKRHITQELTSLADD
eukprot:TRINITY_DN112271_c0_g1_i1.p1 TRINITY_DN112271_c0_g1~~TRINITY_DN112271_c0_g1_i1.p1  ORF type:complete len:288 (+),score=23.82 TRINITY_DN112271_c0_g1_i1:54-917(+)